MNEREPRQGIWIGTNWVIFGLQVRSLRVRYAFDTEVRIVWC